MKKSALLATLVAGMVGVASAEVIYVDFHDDGTTNTSAEAYNVLSTDAGSGQSHPVATAGAGLSMTGLVDTNNIATGVGINLHTYSSFRTAGGLAVGGAYAHQEVVGVATNASVDGYWANDQGNAASFGLIVTFTNLTGDAYDISMLAGSSNAEGTWSVTTGAGDSDTQPYSDAKTEVQEWTGVVPVGGIIELRSLDNGSGNWQTAVINFISLEAVELANSVLGLSPTALSLNLDAPDTSIDGMITASFFPGAASTDVEIVSVVADAGAGFSASVVDTTLGVSNPDEDITVTFDNSSIGLLNGESTNSTLVVTWTEEGSGLNNTSDVALDVTYSDEPSSLKLVPTSLSLELHAPDTTTNGTIVASFVEGSLSADIEVLSLEADSGFSAAPGSFTLSTANTNEDVTVTFDNSTIGLSGIGDAASSTLVVTWTETGSGIINTSEVALVVIYTPEETEVDPEDVVYAGTSTNSTFVFNTVQGTPATGSLTDIGDTLVVTNQGVNFGMVGFASSNDVNTLNGTALTVEDKVTFKLVVDSIVGEIRANGVRFGMSADAANNSGTGDMLVDLQGGNNGSKIGISAASFQDGGWISQKTSNAQLKDGFTLTLTADVEGYTFVLEGVNASTIVMNGTFTNGTEFLEYFSTGHFYFAAQHWNKAAGLVTTVSEAAIWVQDNGAVRPVIEDSYVSDGNLNLTFTGSVGGEYVIEWAGNLVYPQWQMATNIPALPESPMTVELPITEPTVFYRVFTP